MILDLGTGDGRAVLRRARREPSTLVVGVDADGAAMRRASLRAARPLRKGGLPNALFLVATAAELPGPLAGMVEQLTVVLPWGSLLRALVQAEAELLDGLRACLRGEGELELLLSVQPIDRSLNLPVLDHSAVRQLQAAYGRHGLQPQETRQADGRDVERLGSSWARRLAIPDRRPAWLLRFARKEEPREGEGASVQANPAPRDAAPAPLTMET